MRFRARSLDPPIAQKKGDRLGNDELWIRKKKKNL